MPVVSCKTKYTNEPQADEAQHRHYNDSYAPYPSTTPNPYDQFDSQPNPYDRPHSAYGAGGTPLADPFNPPHNPYSSPPPPPNMYPPQPPNPGYGVGFRPPSAPLQHPTSPPPMNVYTPPTLPPNPLIAPSGSSTAYSPGPSANSTPATVYRSGYDLHDDPDHDTGDMPLLRRDPSSMSSIPRVPGQYDDDMDGTSAVGGDDRSENNVRYGRIPQRVPRRYKTIKKVECVLLPVHSLHD